MGWSFFEKITDPVCGKRINPEKAGIAAALEERVLPLLESGAVRPIIHATFPLAEASRAHELMESSEHMGKIVLET